MSNPSKACNPSNPSSYISRSIQSQIPENEESSKASQEERMDTTNSSSFFRAQLPTKTLVPDHGNKSAEAYENMQSNEELFENLLHNEELNIDNMPHLDTVSTIFRDVQGTTAASHEIIQDFEFGFDKLLKNENTNIKKMPDLNSFEYIFKNNEREESNNFSKEDIDRVLRYIENEDPEKMRKVGKALYEEVIRRLGGSKEEEMIGMLDIETCQDENDDDKGGRNEKGKQ